MIGETVTHYRILDKIGEGGMGVVYRAEDTRLGRQVAVKVLTARLAQDAAALDRFQREARAASSLNHPHICTLYDIGQHGDVPFLVMELLAGDTLRHRIGRSPLPIDAVIELATQAADALDVAHAAGIIHRDIKSANLFVTDRGQVKVLDFGLAKLTQSSASGSDDSTTLAPPTHYATGAGQTMGTLSSMSPEQARGEELDARSDLFSFGVVLYEMATGREPFIGRTPALVFDAILHRTPVAPTTLNPEIPAELEHVIVKALEKDRDLRYQTAAELRSDLKRLKRDTGSVRSAVAARAETRPRSRAGGGMVSRRMMLAGAAVLVLALAAGGVWWLRPWGSAVDSVAVLPFAAEAAAGPTGSEYLGDGITETLINGLARVPDLRVSARSMVFRYKDRDLNPQQIGRELNVKALVTGRIATRGDRLHVLVEIMNVENGSQIWGGQYDRPPSELLAVQDEITEDILDKLRPRISGTDKKLATRRYTDDAVAYQAYLQGRYYWNKGTIASYKKAIESFQQAIAKDPKYALAFAGLADSYLLLGSYWVEAITEAKSAALEALRIDPELPEAHVALGHIKLLLDWDWPAAEREFTRGITLDPNSALAHNQYAMYLATMGRQADAIAEVRRAQELDPLSPIINSDLGWYLLYSGKHEDAIAQFRKTLEFDANSVSAHRGLGIASSEAGRHDDAVASLKRALELSENSPVLLGHLGAAHARRGDRTAADAVRRDLQRLGARQYVPASAEAMIAAALGDTRGALDFLERAYAEHDFSIAQIGVVPWFQSLRSEPRFQKLIERLGLPRG